MSVANHNYFRRAARCAVLVLLFCMSASVACRAEKIRAIMPGVVYLSGGDSLLLTDTCRIAIPMKGRPLCIMEHAYTSRQKIHRKIDPASVDSIVLWNELSPTRRHTICFLQGFGWCWELEHGPAARVYALARNGYKIAGNGGMWPIGKYCMLVEIGCRTERFTKTWKWSNRKFRSRLAALVADDPALAAEILESDTRRDKTLRMLRYYTP